MPTPPKDNSDLTANQRLLLEYLIPGEWFDPDTYASLRYIVNRQNSCRHLAIRGILQRRPFSDLGYVSFQFMLTSATAKELKVQHREVESE
jgi:hypothetical protein